MLNLIYLISFIQATLYIQHALGDNPLQRLLATLECFGTTQEGCDTEFTDAHPEVGRSFDNSSRAATRFYLFTPKNVDDPELMHKCGGGLPPNTNFNPKCKTLIVFPGFVSGICHMSVYRELVYQRMKCGCYNYIHVEWTWGNSFDLITAVNNQKIVAKQVAIVIRGLKEKYNLTPTDFICLGHSLGAHGCGLVGQEEEIYAIHGLDPAGVVYWEDMPLDERLDPGDATCVQVAHCNGGQCLPNYFGANFTCGTKDFWFNDGLHQPACHRQQLISFLKGDIIYALASFIPAACNHLHCLYYYKTSMCSPDCKYVGVECNNAANFEAGNCSDCGESGEKCDVFGIDSCNCTTGNNKNYFLKGDIVCPYCDNKGISNVDRVQCPTDDDEKPGVPPIPFFDKL